MQINPPPGAALLTRLPIRHDPANGVVGSRVLIQRGNGEWWAGRTTAHLSQNGREVTTEGAKGLTAQEAILNAIALLGAAEETSFTTTPPGRWTLRRMVTPAESPSSP